MRAAARVAFLAILVCGRGCRKRQVPEPDGYRLENYRSPTPATPRGAKEIGTDEAETDRRSHSAKSIRCAAKAAAKELPVGTIRRDKPRANIPGSIWLPDTGYGELGAGMAGGYFSKGLDKATSGDRGDAGSLLPGGLLDVVERGQTGARVGYSNVVWHPEGTDGWLNALLPLQDCTPEPRPDE